MRQPLDTACVCVFLLFSNMFSPRKQTPDVTNPYIYSASEELFVNDQKCSDQVATGTRHFLRFRAIRYNKVKNVSRYGTGLHTAIATFKIS